MVHVFGTKVCDVSYLFPWIINSVKINMGSDTCHSHVSPHRFCLASCASHHFFSRFFHFWWTVLNTTATPPTHSRLLATDPSSVFLFIRCLLHRVKVINGFDVFGFCFAPLGRPNRCRLSPSLHWNHRFRADISREYFVGGQISVSCDEVFHASLSPCFFRPDPPIHPSSTSNKPGQDHRVNNLSSWFRFAIRVNQFCHF